MRFIFDLVEGSRVRNTVRSVEIVRRVRVDDIPVSAANTAYQALNAILRDPQCPKLFTAHPDLQTKATLEEQVLVSFEQPSRYAFLDLIYRTSAPDPGGSDQIIWTVTDSNTTSFIQTGATSNGKAALGVWYKSGTPGNISDMPAGAIWHGGTVTKVEVDRVIRVTGRATRQQWVAVRKAIRSAKGCINSDNWGGYSRGTWLFFGPNTHTIDRGNTYDIQLEFSEREKGWYPIDVYRDEAGRIPQDVVTEDILRVGGPPAVGTFKTRNGVMMASVQNEKPFKALFNFTPDDEPDPP